ncbi:MAG: acyl carrier protein [Thermoguttaceae bacterium]|jgi:acyl carrier protein
MNNTKERLEKCFALALPDLSKEVVSRASMSSVAAWDSLAAVNLLSLIEEEFNVRVPDADLAIFVSFELILDYLQSKNNGA